MADEGSARGDQPDGQVNPMTVYDDCCKTISDTSIISEVFKNYQDIYKKKGACFNLDVINEMTESYRKTNRRAATFEWDDDHLIKFEKFINPKNADQAEMLEKVYNDPIHGNMKIHPVCQAIIDTPQFQRLRDLKQMGMVSHVYPGAVHTRFEHSLGVCYLAGEFARTLQRNQPFLNVTEKDILCVEIAGLCHDLGHGPFSHLFDGVMKDLLGATYSKHEKRSVAMLDLLIERNKVKLKDSFNKYGLWKDTDWVDKNDFEFIKEMILPPGEDKDRKGRYKLKHFLYEIVCNERTGVDVDKFDYLARDCHHLGMKNNFDHRRFMMFSRVNFINGSGCICVRNKELPNLYNMYITRYTQQKFVWYHHVNTSAELMISRALKIAAPHLKIQWKDNEEIKTCILEECTKEGNLDGFSQLNDNITTQILRSTEEGMDEAQKIILRILERDFYKCVYESEPFELKDESKEKDGAKDIKTKILEKSPKRDFEVKIYSLDLGKKNKKPLDYMPVYSKNNMHVAEKPGESSKILAPVICIEYIVRVIYCGDNTDKERIQELKEAARSCVDAKIKEIKSPESSSEPGPSKRRRVE